jgi:serine/threonine-protein kinase
MNNVVDRAPLFEAGTILNPTYTVEAFLGAGAFGQVYRVNHQYLGRQALKIFPRGIRDFRGDFFREARILVNLTHPNIVRIFDANIIETPLGEVPYLAMEYIDGETLGRMLMRRVRLSLVEASSLTNDLCAGLREAHRLEPPLLHLDLTTENVLLTEQAGSLRAKIADFGIAAQVHPITRMTKAQGTIYFMAPEMFWGYATASSDVYMLGFLIYWLYAGVPPYPVPELSPGASATDWADAVRRARNTPAAPLAKYRLDMPLLTGQAILRALSPEPAKRFPDATAFWAALHPA